MIYAIIMAGGMGTRLKVPDEKPLFKLYNKPLIKYVLENISSSKYIEKTIIAVSHHTPKTTEYLYNLNDFDFEVLDTPGTDYINDLSYILDFFEKKADDDILLFINADLPFVSSDIIDLVLNKYFTISEDSLSTFVPVEIFKKFDLDYSYDYNGLVPSGLNILKSKNIVQNEHIFSLSKPELAININTIKDAKIAKKFFSLFYNK